MTQRTARKVTILGAGAWGTALANVAARAGHDVLIWGHDATHLADIARDRENRRRLPGVALEPRVGVEADIAKAVQADILLAVVPTQHLRETMKACATAIPADVPTIVCAKGIERGTALFLSDVLREIAPQSPPACLSGPSFAEDVSRGLPTAVTLAAESEALAGQLADALATPSFRLYHSGDLRGVEIGGAAKNVLAIACGIAAGRRLGASAGAALVARGFAELVRFGQAFGGKSETLMGLSGLGDLVLTCGSTQSRNFAFGEALGAGKTLAEASGGKLAEGAFTAEVLVAIAGRAGVDLPIAAAVAEIVGGRLSVDEAVETLLARPRRKEI